MSKEVTGNAMQSEFSEYFFSSTMKEIIHTMTGLELSEEWPSIEDLKDFVAQFTGVVILTGEKNIMISISMSTITISTLTAFMVGIQREQLSDEDLNDGISEIANVIGGKVKAKLAMSGSRYTILTPFTIKGQGHYITQRKNVLLFVKKFKASDIEIVAKAFLL